MSLVGRHSSIQEEEEENGEDGGDKETGEAEDRGKGHAHMTDDEVVVGEFSNCFQLDATVVHGLVGIAKRDCDKVARLTRRLGMDVPSHKISKFISLVEQLNAFYGGGGKEEVTEGGGGEEGGEEGSVVGPSGKETHGSGGGSEKTSTKEEDDGIGGGGYAALFHMFDQDNR